MALFIQLIGQPGVGKSFFARKLAEMKQGVVLSFSKDVYRLAAIVKGEPIDKRKKEDRELLRLIGTEWGRESREISEEIEQKLESHKPQEWGTSDIWARIFVSDCRSLPPNVSVVNDDTRFLNELEISMATLGFIPVLVACSEETRRKRLRARGDMHDPSDTNHLSEEIANFLSIHALIQPLLPIIWNDGESSIPLKPWIYGWNEFRSLAAQSDSNIVLAEQLDWTPQRAKTLVMVLRDQLDRQPEVILNE
jgi:dephospho-CoA kinase